MSRPIVLVLAGGVSNRFWPLQDKLFLEFGSQSLLERHLRALQSLGCERFVVVARPESGERIEALGGALGIDLRVALQPEAKGMADACLRAAEAIESLGGGAVYVTQAHDIVESKLHAGLLEAWSHVPSGVAGLVAAVRVQQYFPGGYLRLASERIAGIVEKPQPGAEPSDLVNLVAHLFASWSDLKSTLADEAASDIDTDDAYERALTRLMAGSEFRPHVYEGRWQGLKYPWHALDVMDMLLDLWQRGVESPGPEYEQREPGVFYGPEVRVFPGGYVAGPALLGRGAVIGNNALVRASILGDHCVAGFGSEVARSLLIEHVELHHNYVGDSVFGAGSSMGYGATTANFRIDDRTVPSYVGGQRVDSGRMKLGLMLGAGTRIGVNTSTMPGVKIGAGAMIGPMLRITRDVPDGARVLDEEIYGRF